MWPARSSASISTLLARKCGYASRGRVSKINFHHSARRSLFEGVLVLTKGLSVLETKSMFAERVFFSRPVPPELRAAETPCYLMKLRVSA